MSHVFIIWDFLYSLIDQAIAKILWRSFVALGISNYNDLFGSSLNPSFRSCRAQLDQIRKSSLVANHFPFLYTRLFFWRERLLAYVTSPSASSSCTSPRSLVGLNLKIESHLAQQGGTESASNLNLIVNIRFR